MYTFLTLCFYMMVMSIAILLAKKAVEKNNIRWLLIAIILLSVVAGCRSFEVGTDTLRVVQSIEYTFEKGVFSHSKEFIYYFLCKFLMLIWKNPSFVLTVFAMITNGFVFFRIWDFRNDINISVAVALYFMFYYGLSMNITRQCMAVAIVFYFTRYIQKKKYRYFYFGVIIAFLIHISSCVAAIIPIVYLLFYGNLKLDKEYLKRYGVVGGIIGGIVGLYLGYRYVGYFSEIGINIGLMQTVCLILLVSVYIPVFLKYKGRVQYRRKVVKEVESFHLVFSICALGNLIAFLGYVVPAVGRVGYVFKIYEIIFYSMILEKNFYTPVVKRILYGILILLGMYSLMTYGGIVPYSVVW